MIIRISLFLFISLISSGAYECFVGNFLHVDFNIIEGVRWKSSVFA